MNKFLLIVAALAACAGANDEEYIPSLQGMQGFSIFYETKEDLEFLRKFEDVPGFDFLNIANGTIDVLIAADQLDTFKTVLDNNFIDYTVFVEDIYEKVVEEFNAQEIARKEELLRNNGLFVHPPTTYYMNHNEINTYLTKVAELHKDKVTLINLGLSYEGRTMLGLKISTGGKDKPAILIDAGIHAREWIAPATALYILDQVISNKTNNYLVKNVDWYFIPLMNPDGYDFTHSDSRNRMWRKTRSVIEGTSCIGVDGNRNFDLKWNTIGASDYPCSTTYAGPKAFSEPEARRLRDFIYQENKSKTIKLYISFHSYGQYILYPWGYTDKPAENHDTLYAVGKKAAKAITSVAGKKYTVGAAGKVLYVTSGTSQDWVYGSAGVDLSYTIELPGGVYGFDMPPSKIVPIGAETFEAIKVFHQHVESTYAHNQM